MSDVLMDSTMQNREANFHLPRMILVIEPFEHAKRVKPIQIHSPRIRTLS